MSNSPWTRPARQAQGRRRPLRTTGGIRDAEMARRLLLRDGPALGMALRTVACTGLGSDAHAGWASDVREYAGQAWRTAWRAGQAGRQSGRTYAGQARRAYPPGHRYALHAGSPTALRHVSRPACVGPAGLASRVREAAGSLVQRTTWRRVARSARAGLAGGAGWRKEAAAAGAGPCGPRPRTAQAVLASSSTRPSTQQALDAPLTDASASPSVHH